VRFELINPAELGAPRGWTNGVLAPAGGRVLFVAGQAGWRDADGPAPGFVEQFTAALDRTLAVLRQAGAAPTDVARMTVYVTDVAAYRAARGGLREVWRARFGSYFPAMALVEVTGLVERAAVVEIETTAVLGERR
jgi:enamine deaminase RidA (YjgF/YER057c/UK114 family)